MNRSPDADAILEQIRVLREERRSELQRELHYIDAAYDRRIRRIHEGAALAPLCCVAKTPTRVRRFCLRRVVRFRRRLNQGV